MNKANNILEQIKFALNLWIKDLRLVLIKFQKPSRWTNNLYKNGYRKNKLNRNFSQPEPNLVWVSDFTHINIATISHYICVIIDLFSRKVLAYGITEKVQTQNS